MRQKTTRETEAGQAAVVQTARQAQELFSAFGGYVPLKRPENALYDTMREAVPVIDAAIEKIVRLTGSFIPACKTQRANRALEQFFGSVRVPGGVGINAFTTAYLDSLLTYGNAVGEVVLSKNGDIVALYNAPLENIELRQNPRTLETEVYLRTATGCERVKYPQLVAHSALNPKCGEVWGRSLLCGLPFVCSVLLKIYSSIGQNFERMGNVRFAVTYKPTDGSMDKAYAKDRAQQIAKEWSGAMDSSCGRVRDFVAVGDVDIKVIGADNQVLDSNIPVRQMLEQIVAKVGIPPFMLGLSWSTTERMSSQQADMLTSELESYRRLITPVVLKIATIYLRQMGIADEARIEWDVINLQDEVEQARAKLLLAQSENTGKGGAKGGENN